MRAPSSFILLSLALTGLVLAGVHPCNMVGTRGCDNGDHGDCETRVCGADPRCCNLRWDSVCVIEAGSFCTVDPVTNTSKPLTCGFPSVSSLAAAGFGVAVAVDETACDRAGAIGNATCSIKCADGYVPADGSATSVAGSCTIDQSGTVEYTFLPTAPATLVCTKTSTSASTSTDPLTDNDQEGAKIIGAAVGGAIGALAFVVLVLGVACLLVRRYRAAPQEVGKAEDKELEPVEKKEGAAASSGELSNLSSASGASSSDERV